MASETTLTIVGNLTTDPELRFTGAARPPPTSPCLHASGATATPSSCPTPRDANSPSTWARACLEVHGVVIQGRLRQRMFETREGDKSTVIELDVDEVGPSLRYATAKVTKAARESAGLRFVPDDEPPF